MFELMLFVNLIMDFVPFYSYIMFNNPLVSRGRLLLWKCIAGFKVQIEKQSLFLVNVHTFTFLFMTLTSRIAESAESRLCVVVVQHSPILQQQKASWITNDALKVMSNVEMYVQLAWLPPTFWNIYLRLANCWMSYIGANFFLFASVTADIILNPSASRELDWSGANFTLYSIYTNSVICCSLFPPSPSILELL